MSGFCLLCKLLLFLQSGMGFYADSYSSASWIQSKFLTMFNQAILGKFCEAWNVQFTSLYSMYKLNLWLLLPFNTVFVKYYCPCQCSIFLQPMTQYSNLISFHFWNNAHDDLSYLTPLMGVLSHDEYNKLTSITDALITKKYGE